MEKSDLVRQNCVAASFDNARSITFIPCGNLTLNLVGNDASESSDEVNVYYEIVQKSFNFFSSSTMRWKIPKEHITLSLGCISKTRWYAKFFAVKPIATQFDKLLMALKGCLNELTFTLSAEPLQNQRLKFRLFWIWSFVQGFKRSFKIPCGLKCCLQYTNQLENRSMGSNFVHRDELIKACSRHWRNCVEVR